MANSSNTGPGVVNINTNTSCTIQNRPHLLFADDDETEVLLFELALERAGVLSCLHVVHDGEEAINYLSGIAIYAKPNRKPLAALMLLDLKMPLLDGFDVLGWWGRHRRGRQLPIVVMSSSPYESDVQKAMALGAAAYIVKASDFKYLVHIARNLHRTWLQAPTNSDRGYKKKEEAFGMFSK